LKVEHSDELNTKSKSGSRAMSDAPAPRVALVGIQCVVIDVIVVLAGRARCGPEGVCVV
jgi:hypothetical protein